MATTGREPTPDDYGCAVRAAVRLAGFQSAGAAVTLAVDDISASAGRALTTGERAKIRRMVEEEMAR